MKRRINNKVLLRKMAQEKGVRPSSFAVFSILLICDSVGEGHGKLL